MLRVIIADDEEWICKLIQALADWKRLGMEVVGAASNGLQALEMIRRFSPDVLITDIRMPGCGGLELISRAKAVAPALEVIIISGYAQFDYAQTAIGYGVGEYLLKPINQEALNNTLEKMRFRCLARRREESQRESLLLSGREEGERLRARLIPDLLDGRYRAQSDAELEKSYRFQGQGDTRQVFLLKMDYDIDQFQEASLEIVRNKAVDVFRPLLSSLCGDLILGGRGAAVYGVLRYHGEARELVRGKLREGLNQLVAVNGLFGPVVFSMALGQPVVSARALPESLASALGAVAERLTEGTGRLLEGSVSPSGFQDTYALAKYAQAIDHAIDVLSQEEAQSAAAQLEEAASAVPNIRGGEVSKLLRDAGILFVTRLGADNREQVLADFEERCAQCSTVRELFSTLKRLQQSLLAAALEKQKNHAGQPIRLAKQYIQKHFSQPLTLEEVSEAIGFSVSYFSTIFKRETGEGFSKYLTRIRIQEARSLLRETRMPVGEVCRQVGYADIKHFTHTFKAETGLTPGEFRKLYG
ncbi:MAG: response regulator [Candidatus Limiplasma sp.]|nr:response regulator [Candidatus Limiplasma sp.]